MPKTFVDMLKLFLQCSKMMNLKAILIFLFISKAFSKVPEDAIKCSSNRNCTNANFLGTFPDRSACPASEVMFPTTEEELISIVASATRSNRKMKAASRFYHSIPKLVCPDTQNGLLISTKNLNQILKIDVEARTMTVQSGATVREVIAEAAKKGLALPHTPYWWGVTIGGVVATGAHGTSLWGKGGAVHERVVELRIVSPAGVEDGYAKVRTLGESDEDLNAAKVSLGVLGVISQITLKLEPLFKRSVTFITKNDSDLGDKVISFGEKHEFGDITWYPSQREAVYRVDHRVSINMSGNGTYDFLPFRPQLPSELMAQRVTEEELEATGYAYGKCIQAKAVTTILKNNAYGLTNSGKTFSGYPVIGFSNQLQSSGTCLTSTEDDDIDNRVCPWDSRFNGNFFHQTTFSIPLSAVKSFIEDVQKLVELKPHALCGLELYNGIIIRYVKASSAYLGKTQDGVEFDITYYRSKDPLLPRLHQDIFEEIEQLGVFKYGGLPHWGKNRNIAFDGVIRKYHNAGKFLRVKEVYDSQGLFSSEWTDQVLGLKEGVTMLKDGCALEGLCICSQHSHCAPSKGYFCRSGRVYKEARVCALQDPALEQATNLKDDI